MTNKLQTWVNQVANKPIPVLNLSVQHLNVLCNKPNVTMNKLVDAIEQDPGLSVQILRISSSKTRGSLRTDIASIQQALMIMGIEQIRKLPHNLPPLDKNLTAASRRHLLSTYSRAYHAATQAISWAKQRNDMTPDEVYAATFMHFLGEMVIAIYAPDQLERIYRMRKEKHIASEEAQYIVLGFTIDELTLALVNNWKLPELVKDALCAENTNSPRAYGIMLAVQLIRHAEFCWHSDKTLVIMEKAAQWLGISCNKIISDVHQLAASIARHSKLYEVNPLAYSLIMLPIKNNIKQLVENNISLDQRSAAICLTPQENILREVLSILDNQQSNLTDINEVMKLVIKAMHDGIGLNRVVFTLLSQDRKSLIINAAAGTDNDPVFNKFCIKLNTENLFVRLLDKQQAIWINDSNRAKMWPLVPKEVQVLIEINSFFAMSIHVKNKAVGMFYADRHNPACKLDEKSYRHFKTLCTHTATAMHRFSKITQI